MIENVVIRLNGRVLGGWKSFTFTQGIDEPASAFEIQTTKDPRYLSEPITQSLPITIEANGDLLLTGHLEDFDLDSDRQSGRELVLRGRSKTADIITASVVGSYPTQNTLQYITALLKPFGLEVETDGTDWADHLEITPRYGQTVLGAIYDGLQELPRKTISVTKDGKLRIWDAENRPNQGSIAIGSGVKVARISYKTSNQFSDVRSAAQDGAWFEQVQATEIEGRVGTTFPRYRPVIVFPTPDMNTPKAQANAERVASRVVGSGLELTLTTTSWRDQSGNFWEPNAQLWVDLPDISQSSEMIIQRIALTQDLDSGGGTQAEITLSPSVKYASNPNEDVKAATPAKSRAKVPNASPSKVVQPSVDPEEVTRAAMESTDPFFQTSGFAG